MATKRISSFEAFDERIAQIIQRIKKIELEDKKQKDMQAKVSNQDTAISKLSNKLADKELLINKLTKATEKQATELLKLKKECSEQKKMAAKTASKLDSVQKKAESAVKEVDRLNGELKVFSSLPEQIKHVKVNTEKTVKDLESRHKTLIDSLYKSAALKFTNIKEDMEKRFELARKAAVAANKKEIKPIIVDSKPKITTEKAIGKDDIISTIKETVNINFINKLYRK